MAYVFTNTITTIPYYYVKVEIIADAGTTATLTVTNGGYVMSLGDLEQSIDTGTGAYNPGQMSIALRNIDEVFSTNVFTDSIINIELRVSISYDAGSTYENLFVGFIDYQSRDYEEKDTSNIEPRIYRVKANDALMSLRNKPTSLFTGSPPANLITETNVPARNIWSNTLDDVGTFGTLDFASIDEILLSAQGNIPFISGTNPAFAITVSDGGMVLQAGAVTGGLTEAAVVWTLPQASYDAGFASFGNPAENGASQWAASIYSAQNMLQAIKQIAESFLLVGIPRLTFSPLTYTLNYEPMNAVTPGGTNTIAGSLGEFYKKDGKATQWYDTIGINTVNLPVLGNSESTLGGKTREFTNRFCTSVDISLALYYLSKVDGRGLGLFPEYNTHGFGGQLLYVDDGAGNLANVLQMKHRGTQGFFPSSASADKDLAWYGVQDSLRDSVITDSGTSMLLRSQRRSIQGRYKTLRGNDLWDFRVGKDTSIDGKTFRIYKTVKSITNNTTDVDLLEETT